jgi:hypothetical protein
MTHSSAEITITVACSSSYSITAASGSTSQDVTFSDSSVGFVLPTYTSSQQTGCPTNLIEVTTSNSAVAAHSGLDDPVQVSSTFVVKPADTSIHQAYTFYTKVTASGGSTAFFGPYILNVGCFAGHTTFSNSGSFSTSGVSKLVGDSVASVYTLEQPTTSHAYCSILSNVAVE